MAWFARVGGALLVIATLAPACAVAQRGGRRSTGPVGTTTAPPPGSHPQAGLGIMKGRDHGGRPAQTMRPPILRGFGVGLLRGGLFDPYCCATTYVESAPAPAPVTYYYYYPVPYASPAAAPAPAPPYDPTRSRTLLISEGVDGGAGVMRIERAADSLRVTWRGASQPVRQALLFLADSLQQPLVSALVTAERPVVSFPLATLAPRIAYTGLTVVSSDGATATTLVPYRRR